MLFGVDFIEIFRVLFFLSVGLLVLSSTVHFLFYRGKDGKEENSCMTMFILFMLALTSGILLLVFKYL
jgi:hypothetical protein